jgi:hypothetical protein
VAVASGTSYDQILLNSWFLNVFQIMVLGIALIAQELLIGIYAGLVKTVPTEAPSPVEAPRSAARRFRAPVLAIRVFFIVAGTLWVLSGLVGLTAHASSATFPGFLVGDLLQHGFVGVIAIAAGLTPSLLLGLSTQDQRARVVRAGRALLLVGGASIAVGVPPPLTGWGLSGFGNYLLGAVGVPTRMGGVMPPGGGGVVLDLGIASLYALLGVLAVLLALYPDRMLREFGGGSGGPPCRLGERALAPPDVRRASAESDL